MSTEYAGPVPRVGSHVEVVGHSAMQIVVDINLLMQTVNVKATDGEGHVTRNVPWTSLKL
jgi:hypothetical protein